MIGVSVLDEVRELENKRGERERGEPDATFRTGSVLAWLTLKNQIIVNTVHSVSLVKLFCSNGRETGERWNVTADGFGGRANVMKRS